MPDTESMKIRFNKNVVFGWGHIIAVAALVFSLGGTWALIQQSMKETHEVSERQVTRAALVDGKLEKIDEKIAELAKSTAKDIADTRKDIAVSQANQAIISKQISDLREDLRSDRAKPAVYRTGGSN